MIAEIDKARHRHNAALTSAMVALADLRALTRVDGADVINACYVDAITAVDEAANAAINSVAAARHAEDDSGATIRVEGDYIRVGDVTDAENIAIGKDIDQSIGEKKR